PAFRRRLDFASQRGKYLALLAETTDSKCFEIASIVRVKSSPDLKQRLAALIERNVTQRKRDFAPNAGRWIAGHPLCHGEHVNVRSPQRAIRDQTCGGIFRREEWTDFCRTVAA